jgi:hypothetical protein
VLKGPRQERTITRDVATNEVIYTVLRDEGRSVIDEIDVESGFEKKVVYRIKPDDPTSARVDLREAYVLRHDRGWDSFVETENALSSTKSEFLIEASLKAFEGGKPVFAKSWLQRIPRKGV